MENANHKFRVIYFLVFIGDLTLSMVIVISVLYGTNIGLTTIEVGLIGSAYGISYIVMPAILGRLSDKISRKISLTIATLGQMILMLFFIFIITQMRNVIFFGLFVGLLLYGIIYGFFYPSIEAYISENTEDSGKNHEIGISNFCISWSLGFAVGPLLAGFFSDYNVISGFILAFIFYSSSLILIFFKFPLIKPKNNLLYNNKTNQFKESDKSEGNINYSHFSNKKLILLLMGVMIYAIISKMLLSYFTNYAALPKGLNWNGTLIGQVMLFFGLGRTCYFLLARFLKNSYSAITQSFFIIGICLIILAFFYPPILIMVILFITGFFIGRTYLVSLELILKYEKDKKGAKAGIFESIVGIGSAFSPLIAGIIATIDLKMPFYTFSIIVFTFFIIHIVFKKDFQFEKDLSL